MVIKSLKKKIKIYVSFTKIKTVVKKIKNKTENLGNLPTDIKIAVSGDRISETAPETEITNQDFTNKPEVNCDSKG